MTLGSGGCRKAMQAKHLHCLKHGNGGKVLRELFKKFITYSLTIF
jgi:hypothetical protein